MSSRYAADLRSLRAYAPMSRFSITVMPGKMPRPSGAWQMPIVVRWCAGILVMSWPSNSTRPALTLRIPESMRSVVDLPAPLAPMSVTISPSSTWKEMPLMRLDAAVEDADVLDLKQHRAAPRGRRR